MTSSFAFLLGVILAALFFAVAWRLKDGRPAVVVRRIGPDLRAQRLRQQRLREVR